MLVVQGRDGSVEGPISVYVTYLPHLVGPALLPGPDFQSSQPLASTHAGATAPIRTVLRPALGVAG
jgi:hypothetical protein